MRLLDNFLNRLAPAVNATLRALTPSADPGQDNAAPDPDRATKPPLFDSRYEPPKPGEPTITVGGVAVVGNPVVAEMIAAVAAMPKATLDDLIGMRGPVEAAFPGVTRELPHPGLRIAPPWDFAALLRLPPADAAPVRAAIAAYHDAGFIRRPADEKRTILATLAAILPPKDSARLARWHLPRPARTSTKKPITLALESETRDLGRVYRYYAPDPSGKLELRAMNDTLKEKLLAPGSRWLLKSRSPLDARMSDDVWLSSLRWRDLSPSAQHEYLKGYQDAVDPKVQLHKITDAKHAPTGVLAPASLQDTLKWERELKLTIAELITKGSYESLDVARADREWIGERFDSGFHLHAVTELSSGEDKQLLGPKLTALAALHDVALFASAAGSHATNYTHAFLEPWTAAFANEVAGSFVNATIDTDAILAHKFHMVGMRTSIYGQEDRLGLEIRGVQPNLREKFDHATERVVDLVSGGGVLNLPTPPWPGWDAGDKDVGKAFESEARTEMKRLGARWAELEHNAQLSFDDVMDLVVRGSGQKNGFAFSAPLWNFEALPGLNDADKAQIKKARRGFTDTLLLMSEMLSKQIELGRDLDSLAPHVYDKVITAAMTFFQTAGIGAAVERVLDEAARQGAPA